MISRRHIAGLAAEDALAPTLAAAQVGMPPAPTERPRRSLDPDIRMRQDEAAAQRRRN